MEDDRSDNVGANQNSVNILEYFRLNVNDGADKESSRSLVQRIHSEFSDVFTGIGCFESTFKLKVKEGSCLYKAPPRKVAYALEQPCRDHHNLKLS